MGKSRSGWHRKRTLMAKLTPTWDGEFKNGTVLPVEWSTPQSFRPEVKEYSRKADPQTIERIRYVKLVIGILGDRPGSGAAGFRQHRGNGGMDR